MAGCEDFPREKRLKLTLPEEAKSCEELSDSDSEVSLILDLDKSEENEIQKSPENPSTSKEQATNNIVFSLKCLHEDERSEDSESSENNSLIEPEYIESTENDNISDPEHIDASEVPELSLECLYEENPMNTEEHTVITKKANEKQSPEGLTEYILISEAPNNSEPVGSFIVRHSSYVHLRSNWEGAHKFKIIISCSENQKSSDGAVYCNIKNKLYVGKDFPFRVLVNGENVPRGSIIKVTAAFISAEHSNSVVHRCPTHMQQDYLLGSRAYEHLVQCLSDNTFYERDSKTGRCSLSIPYEPPQDGESYTAYLFQLTCFSSCVGGLNRRPFMLIFTLENNDVLLGRQTMETKVCACPMRDIRSDTVRELRQKSNIQNELPLSVISVRSSSSEKYTISTKDVELYRFLKEMKLLYETSAFVKKSLKNLGT